MLRDNHFQLYIPVRRVWELQAEKIALVSSKSRQWKSMLPTVPVLNHHPTHKASRRIAMWPVMERWWGRQCHFSVVPARCKLTLLLSSLMEEEAFTGCRLPPEETLTQFSGTRCDFCRHQALRALLLLWAFSSYHLAWAYRNCTCIKSLSWGSQGAAKAIYPILRIKKMGHRVAER